jgi:ABC-type Mn2+/Zn2+ transport system permease subunit
MTHPLDLFRPEFDFVLRGLWAGLIVGLLCAYMGVYVVLKRIVFVGAALAEVATVGVALSFLPVVAGLAPLALLDPEHTRPLVLALLLVLVGALFFSQQTGSGQVPRESVIGVAYAAATAFAILCLATSPSGEQHALDLIQGDVMTIDPAAIRQLLLIAVPVAILHGLLFKEFLLVSFDAEFARTVGLRARAIELLFYLSLGLMIAVAIKIVGTLLVVGFLVLPAVAALRLTRHLHAAFAIALLIAVVSTIAGIYLSAWHGSNIPMGPAMAAAAAVLLVALWPLRWLGGRISTSRAA